MEDIKNLEDLLRPRMRPGSVVVGHQSTKLTEPGENYGSLIRAVDVAVKNPDGSQDTLHMVAKQIPSNPWLRQVFKIQHTFAKEMNLYAEIVPTLADFQRQQGMSHVVDFFPKYFGGRKNLNGSEVVDEDGVILLENLKASGYVTCDRFSGFDLDGAKVVLGHLATFHAVPLALKLKKPEVFEEKIAPHIRFVQIFEKSTEEVEAKIVDRIKDHARRVDDKLVDRALEAYRSSLETANRRFEGPFNTMVHNDFWVNNTMVKVVEGKIVDSKMVDFQMLEHSSAAKDVIFFLYSSVQIPVTRDHHEELIKFYHEKFVEVLRELDCDVSGRGLEAFEKEIALAAKRSEFFHCLMMTKPIFTPCQDVKELDELKEDDFMADEPSEGEAKMARFIIEQFAKRNWI